MKIRTIFISHASVDSLAAKETAKRLEDRGFECLIDLAALNTGDNFVSFMESALSRADYCLLLWSRSAFESPWVQAEWHAALVRSVLERCAFLITARLEELPVPRLLAPRLWIDFFPVLSVGVEQLLGRLRLDENAATISNKPIGAPRSGLPQPASGAALYISSDLFDIVIPITAELTAPIGALLTSVLQWLQLPSHQQLDLRGRLSVKMSYELSLGTAALPRDRTLLDAGVKEGAVLQLLTFCEINSSIDPISGGNIGKLAFRSFHENQSLVAAPHSPDLDMALARAKSAFRTVLVRNGLRRLSS